MARGRKPQPTALRIVRGNPGKRKLPVGEPQPARDLPSPPAHLGETAMVEWERLAPELHRIGVLTMADRTAMAAYCRLYERWALAEQAAQDALTTQTPNGYAIQNVYIGIANRALELMHKYMVELGLTPSSRVKLAKGEPKVDDPLEAFLKPPKKPRARR